MHKPVVRTVRKTQNGVTYLTGELQAKKGVVTKVILWRIPHNSNAEDIRLKLGRYKITYPLGDVLDCDDPKSELTLDDREFRALLNFIDQNYEPFRQNIDSFVPVNENVDADILHHLKDILRDPKKGHIISLIVENDVVLEDLLLAVQQKSRIKAVREFENMLSQDMCEQPWQEWFKKNSWVLGSDIIKVIDDRRINVENTADYLVEAYDGFLDIIEIKRPGGSLCFWASARVRENLIPSSDLTAAITQSVRYIFELEKLSNNIDSARRLENIRTVKPRCILVFGRSTNWGSEEREAFRILNSSYHNLTILTYDHVFARTKRLVGIAENSVAKIDEDIIPF